MYNHDWCQITEVVRTKPEPPSEHWRNGQRGTDKPSDQRKTLKLGAFQLSFQHTVIGARNEGKGENYWREKSELVVYIV